MAVKKSSGISLIEVLVTTTIAFIVTTMAVQTLYQVRRDNNNSIQELEIKDTNLEAKSILRNLIRNAQINGDTTYAFWKAKDESVGQIVDINPLNYPIIYAQQQPLSMSNFPSNVQSGTDVLVLQSITNPQTVSMVNSGSTTLTRVVNANTPSVNNNKYMLLADESNLDLLLSTSSASNTDSTINSSVINHTYPSGSTLYTNYKFQIIYVGDTGNTDSDGNPIFALYEKEYQSNNSGTAPQELITGLENLQIFYYFDNQWQRVDPATDVDDEYQGLWYSRIKGIRLNYNLDGTAQQLIISFRATGIA